MLPLQVVLNKHHRARLNGLRIWEGKYIYVKTAVIAQLQQHETERRNDINISFIFIFYLYTYYLYIYYLQIYYLYIIYILIYFLFILFRGFNLKCLLYTYILHAWSLVQYCSVVGLQTNDWIMVGLIYSVDSYTDVLIIEQTTGTWKLQGLGTC